MALTKDARTVAVPEVEEGRRGLGHPAVLVLAALVVLLLYWWPFIQDPTLTAPTRDPAWYTWKVGVLTSDTPDLITQEWGPFGMFDGGYRVTVPVAGGLLEHLAGVDQFTFVTFLMVGIPVLGSLALGAFGYRHRRDPVLMLLTLLVGAGLFLTTPYVGYLDNLMVLYLLAMLLPFLEPARTSWGAKSALFLFGFLASLTHPTTAVIFGVVMVAGAGLHWLTSRFSIKKTLDRDGPALMGVGFGMIAGLLPWVLGFWGSSASLAEAALPPPYTQEFFFSRLGGWVTSLQPIVTGPLVLAAIAGVWLEARRTRELAHESSRFPFLWALPLLGLFGWVAGLSYPYYRFMNATLAPMLIVGLGAWFAVRWLLRDRRRPLGIAGVVVIVGALAWVVWQGLGGWASAGWISNETRAAMASARAYANTVSEDRPVLFVQNYRDTFLAWGWSKTYTNVTRAALDGDDVERSVFYFGDLDAFLAGEPATGANGEQDCHGPFEEVRDRIFETTANIYDCVSRGFLDETEERIAGFESAGTFTEPPVVFMVREFNKDTGNEAVIDAPGGSTAVALGPDVVVVTGDGLAPIDQEAVGLAVAAGEAETERLTNHEGPFGDPVHLLGVLIGLVVLLVLPGLLAVRWFQLEDFAVKFALVPGLSIGLALTSAFFVVAFTRDPFSATDAWASAAIAVAAGAWLGFLARRRDAGKGVVEPWLERKARRPSGFVHNALSLFSNESFAFLMGAQFLAVFGDGMVQGALAKAIAFGGEKGFSIEGARSPNQIMLLVLLTYLPYTLFSPFVGVLIDRFDRRIVLVLSNAIRAVLLFLFAATAVVLGGIDNVGNATLIAALLLTLGSTRVLLAVKSAGIASVLGEKNLLQGNSIAQIGSAFFQIMGGGIALVGTSLAPAAFIVVIGAVIYGAGSYAASQVRRLEHIRPTTRWVEEVRRVFRDIWAGLREVARRPGAGMGLTAFFVVRTVLVSFVGLYLALEAREILGGDSGQAGIAIAGGLGALGAGLGFVTAAALRHRVLPERLLVVSMTTAGVGLAVAAGIPGIFGLSLVAFAAAMGFFVSKVSADTILQESLPDHFRGRGFSLFDIAYNIGWVLGALALFLFWNEAGGNRVLMITAGVVMVVIGLGFAAWARRIGKIVPVEQPEAVAAREPGRS